ncbi:MAG: PEP/pyruvate-binding domain-containing protein, partial [Deltaproteobacteria bacterium]|nr:PEP/pyruvate-binding domain-containing protein [Deltaproteobacteria bacterium]
MELVLSLDQIGSDDRESVGGKSLALATMVKNGMKVPEALCLKADAYHRYLETTGLGARILMEFNRKDFAEVRWEEMWDAALRIRNLFIHTPMPSDLRTSLQSVFASRLPGESVVVRSSAPGEDSLHASFAGLHESYVNVQGVDSILEHIRLVWASLWSDRALLYRQELGLDVEKSSMAVVVQKLVSGDRSGVAFGKNPNAPHQAVIESVYGLNQGLVDGSIEPDRWLLDRKNGTIVSHFPANREKEMVAGPDSTRLQTLSAEQQANPPLSEDEVARVFRLALQAEELFGSPQDVEWTFVGGELYVLQSRPITSIGAEQEQDSRAWYFTLRRSFENLRSLRTRVESELIPEMEREARFFAQRDLSNLADNELAQELASRQQAHDRWKDIYWSEFIPLAHGIRLFGQVYNDAVRPSDPYEFMDLLGATEMMSLERNRRLENMAAMIRGDSNLSDSLSNLSNPQPDHPFSLALEDFTDKFGDLSCSEELCTQGGDAIVRLLLEMASRPAAKERFRAGDVEALVESFLSRFEGEKREKMEELLDLGRASYRLRDDDNIYFGMIENQLRLAIEESKGRLAHRGNIEVDGLDPMEVINALNDPDYLPKTATVTKVDETNFEVRPRQLVGQPA